MRCRLLILIALFGLFIGVCPLLSQAQSLEGTVSVTGKTYDVNGNKAKAHEYSDHSSGVFLGKGSLFYDSPTYYLGLFAKNPGYDDQHYRLDGGAYGKFKYWFDYNEIIHNNAFDAKTFYGGAGGDTLTGAANTNPDTWGGSFDYYTQRKKIDTGLSFTIPKPFFFNVAYSHEKKEGIMPIGVSTGGTAAASLELPAPVDYRSNGFTVEGGYAKKPYFLSFSYAYSEFTNESEDLSFTPVSSSSGLLSLPPDNKVHKFSLKGSADLPMHSKFSINLGDSRTTSDVSSSTAFDGEIDTSNYDFILTSKPLNFLDAKLYYKYYERDNKSTGQVLVGSTLTTTNPLYYQTDTYGAEVGVQLPEHLYLTGGYRYVDTARRIGNLDDPSLALPYNWDNIYSADLKWTGLDILTGRVGFERLNRGADYRNEESRNALNRKFAYAAQNRDTFNVGIDLSPVETFNVSLDYRYKKSNYNDTAFGYTADTRHAFNMNADYAVKKFARLYGYVDYEKATLDQRALINASPWESTQEEKTYGYGLRSDVYIIPKKLTLILQYDYLRANGNNDLSFYDNAIWAAINVPVGLPVDIPAWDDYQKYSCRVSAAYQWSESLSTKLGYAYERYKYSDAQVKGYQYYAGGPGSSQAYLTGAYSSPSYSANILFLTLAYKFR